MNAITISNKILDQNTQNWIQNKTVGDIVRRSDLPNKFYVTENVIGGYASRTDLHDADGWRPYLNLVDGVDYDSATQKLNTNLIAGYPIGEPLAARTHYAFKIVDLTQEQINQQVEGNSQETARQKIERYFDDGRELTIDFRLRLFRRNQRENTDDGFLTKTQVGKMDRWFDDVLKCLLLGNFREARRLVKPIVINKWVGVFDDGDGNVIAGNGDLETSGMRWLANKLYEDINDYFDNEYDL